MSRIVFRDFLKERGALEGYVRNRLWILKRVMGREPLPFMLTPVIIPSNVTRYWVYRGFNWSRTPEGEEYWYDIDKAWKVINGPEDWKGLPRNGDTFEAGIPLNDALGLELVLATLEDGDEENQF